MRARRLMMSLIVLCGAAIPAHAAVPEDSVVRVFTTMRLPSLVRPWTKQNPVEIGGTGVVIDGKRILTNAHVVLYATEVAIQPREGGDRIEAKVVAIAPGIDLAVLSLDDPEFFDTHPPMPRAEALPAVQSNVFVGGFSVGGNGLAVTRGIVSRVDYAAYDHQTYGLRLQVDAAVTSGSSGGPALVDDKMVGITYGHLSQAENVGYIIPNEEIDAFLADVADGHYDGRPGVIDGYQSLENEALRAKLGLARSVRGIMVRESGRRDSSYPIREGDVLIKIGDQPIDNEGTIPYRPDLRLPFLALIPKVAQDGKVPVTLIRDGQTLEVEMPLGREDDRLIPSIVIRGIYPSYFIHGPLVFSPASIEGVSSYIQMNPDLAGRNSPLSTRHDDKVQFPAEELVVVTSPLFAHKIAKGYGDPVGEVVADVNGTKIKNLRHLVEVLRDNKDEFLTFRFGGDPSEVLVFRREAMDAATGQIMAENGIPRRGSDDVLSVWNQPSPTPE